MPEELHCLIDSLIFSKIKAKIGKNVRLIVCHGAPMPPEILKFLKISLCVDVLEAYGLAESGVISCLSISGDAQTGTFGGPL